MDDFDKYLGEQLNDPEFKKEWDSSEMEYQLMMMVLKARNEQNLTQSELAGAGITLHPHAQQDCPRTGQGTANQICIAGKELSG